MIYRQAKAIRRVKEEEIVPALLEEIERFVADKAAGRVTDPSESVEETPAPSSPLVSLQ